MNPKTIKPLHETHPHDSEFTHHVSRITPTQHVSPHPPQFDFPSRSPLLSGKTLEGIVLFPFVASSTQPRVVVTGAGIVTALGLGWKRANADGFRAGKSAMRPITLFDVSRQRTKIGARKWICRKHCFRTHFAPRPAALGSRGENVAARGG